MTKIALPETFLSLKSKIHRRNILGTILKFLAPSRPSRRKHTGKKTLPREKRKLRHYIQIDEVVDTASMNFIVRKYRLEGQCGCSVGIIY